MNVNDIVGNKYGRLTVISFSHNIKTLNKIHKGIYPLEALELK